VKKAGFRIEFAHFLPEDDTGPLKHVFDIGWIYQLFGDKGVDAMPVLHQASDERVGHGVFGG
jgi:hypothetical protein